MKIQLHSFTRSNRKFLQCPSTTMSNADKSLTNWFLNWSTAWSLHLLSSWQPGCRCVIDEGEWRMQRNHWNLRWKTEVLPSGFGKCSRFVRSEPVALTRPITVPAGGHVPAIVAVHHRACFLAPGGATLFWMKSPNPPVAPICNVTPRMNSRNETKAGVGGRKGT